MLGPLEYEWLLKTQVPEVDTLWVFWVTPGGGWSGGKEAEPNRDSRRRAKKLLVTFINLKQTYL